jgi:hypothetical protein
MKLTGFAGLTIKACQYPLVCLFVLLLCPGVPRAQAQTTLSVSPISISFGIPTMSSLTSAPTASQTLNVIVGGSGSATLSAVVAGTNAADFVATVPSLCTGTITAPAVCNVSVTFTDSSALGETPNILETATLTVTLTPTGDSSGGGSIAVPLSGAYGAIKLWNSNSVQPSVGTASFTDLYPIATASPNLSCPGPPSAAPSAILSNTPDGLGNAMVDNYITLQINGTPVTTYLSAATETEGVGYSAIYPGQPNGLMLPPATTTPAYPLGNVCYGSDAYPDTDANGNIYPECFSAAYRADVSNLIGENDDLITNANNIIPALNGNTSGGVPYPSSENLTSGLNISTFFAPGTVQATITALDAGGYYDTSTIFLVTNCLFTGSAGGTSSGNPINTSLPGTLVQGGSPSQGISVSFNDYLAFGTTDPGIPPPAGATPMFSLVPIPYSTFTSLVKGTSSAPAVCLRITGLESSGEPVCGGFEFVCEATVGGVTTVNGANCGTSPVRNLLDSLQFASPDIPGPPFNLVNNFLTSCSNYLSTLAISPGVCALGTGPGMVMFGDASDPAPTCPFMSGSPLAALSCPLNTLTSYLGAADGQPGSGTPGRNSIYVPVVNEPSPFTIAYIPGHLDNWVSLDPGAFSATFISNEAVYIRLPFNPPANSFNPAPPNNVTAGVSQTIPDSSLPLSGVGVMTKYNSNASAFQPGPPPMPICTPPTPASFTSSMTFNQTINGTPLTDGLYYLIYYTTDCSFTEELHYHPTSSQLTDPSANWASFPNIPIGIDSLAPNLASYSFSPAGSKGYPAGTFTKGSKVSISFTCTDDRSGIGNCGGVPLVCPLAPNAGPLNFTTPQVPVNTSKTGMITVTATATDCAGNNSSPPTSVTYTVVN